MRKIILLLTVIVLLSSCDNKTLLSQIDRNANVFENNESDQQKDEIVATVTVNSENAVLDVNGVTLNLIKVEGGTFLMGKDNGFYEEWPPHYVTLSSDYYIGQTEVTQALWSAIMNYNNSDYKGDNLPVNNVSWTECQVFIDSLKKLTGKTFAFPTEAQWEFAARGGNKSHGYIYSGGNVIGNVAWYSYNSLNRIHSVGMKQSNELGLCDMSGNVCEWCADWYGYYSSSSQTDPTGPSSGSDRVYRGGHFYDIPNLCSPVFRQSMLPGLRLDYIGFRIVLAL